MNKQNIFEGRGEMSTFICIPPKGFYHARLTTVLELEQWTNRNQELIQRTNKKQGGPPSNLHPTPINIISPIQYVVTLTSSEAQL